MKTIMLLSSMLISSMVLAQEEFKLTNEKLNKEYKLPIIKNHSKSGRKYVQIYNDGEWEVRKSILSNNISVLRRSDSVGQYKEIKLPEKIRKDLYLMNVGTNNHIEKGTIFLVGYDTYENTPSGRKLTGVTNGLNIIQIDRDGVLKEVEKNIPIAGLDDKVYVNYGSRKITICAVSNCYSVDYKGGYEQWSNKLADSKYELVEAVFVNEDKVAAIVRRKFDDRFDNVNDLNKVNIFLNALITKNDIDFFDLKSNGVAYGLEVINGSISYRLAKDPAGYRELLKYEYSRMNLDGLIDFGSNNLEGRVAWSQAYYIKGLMALHSRSVNKNLAFEGIKERLLLEVSALNDICLSEYPYFLTKRYSVEREPILYALHLGRAATIIKKANDLSLMDTESCLEKLKADMLGFNTVEVDVVNDHNEFVGLAYRYAVPFWADGVNAPYNFISGYVDAVLSVDSDKKLNKSLFSLLENEFYSKTELPKIWNYWGGLGNEGWDGGDISSNTITYSGNNDAKAHITYRIMDASALIGLYKVYEEDSVKPEIISHLKDLTSKGYLLPSINDSWFSAEGYKINLDIKRNQIMRFSRSASHYELYSQVFVLDALVSNHYNE